MFRVFALAVNVSDQARRENLSEGITIEQIIYLLDTLHPSQLIENKVLEKMTIT